MNQGPDNRVIIVLGMHRSGTSALTGSLEAGGVFLGDTNHAAPDNLKGNRESSHIMALHNDLLERNGGSWDKPVQNPKWDPVHKALRDSIIECYRDKPLWGFKDPRTVFTLQGWTSALPNAELIGIFRHPFVVAESLHTRDGIAYEAGLELWLEYNRVLFWSLNNVAKFPLVEFSENSDDFLQQLDLLSAKMKLSTTAERFFDSSLKSSVPPDLTANKNAHAAMTLYQNLIALRIDA